MKTGPDISLNCRRAQGRPNRDHHCTGCECECHAVAPPIEKMRAAYETARAARQEARQEP